MAWDRYECYGGNQHVSKQKYSVLLKMQKAIIIQNSSITDTADNLKTSTYLK
jgi:hypothetical protein